MITTQDYPVQSINNPVLHLDGKRLRTAFESMVDGAEKLGGIEVVVDGLGGKSLLFQRTFGGNAENLLESEFLDACAFMPTVRRRIKSAFGQFGFESINKTVTKLLCDVSIENVDEKIETFETDLTGPSKFRWVRDFAAEILHYRDPDTFPLDDPLGLGLWIEFRGVARNLVFRIRYGNPEHSARGQDTSGASPRIE